MEFQDGVKKSLHRGQGTSNSLMFRVLGLYSGPYSPPPRLARVCHALTCSPSLLLL